MKLVIGYYEVDVKAKYVAESRANKEATTYFLNSIAAALNAQAEKEEKLGLPLAAKKTSQDAMQIHDFLDSKHFYDDLRKELGYYEEH